MSPQVFSCILCGVPIHDYDASTTGSWSDQFRIIYSDSTGCFYSGVGCRDNNNDLEWVASSDPNLRWDDERSHGTSVDVGVMSQSPRGGKHGFILHESCWQLLKTAFPSISEEVPLKRLLDICGSLPFPIPSESVYWGHDYGHLVVDIEDQQLYPWEEAYLGDIFHSAEGEYANEDPYHVSDFPASLSVRTDYPIQLSISTQSRNKDPFSKLPLELLENIALNLPTESALNLRLVSKVFFPLLYSQNFWASRFEARGDRGFAFETWGHRRSASDTIDWLSLYRLTSLTRCSPGLKNRRRIWGLIQPLIETINLSVADDVVLEGQNLDSLKWVKAEGDLTTRYPKYYKGGCRLLGTHMIRIPKRASKIAFSISSVGNASFISGMRFITDQGSDVCLGLISKTNEIIHGVTKLRGFVLAMSSRGLQALQLIQEDSNVSDWIGCPGRSPQRLLISESFEYLEVGYDGFRIVSLGVSDSVRTSDIESKSLRETALWYPSVPSPELCLNDQSYTGGTNPNTKQEGANYLPLFWTHFGGPGGCLLKHLTGVSFDAARGLCGFEFHYDKDLIQAPCKIGLSRQSDSSKYERFTIDGPGGEIIESVEVLLERLHFFSFLRDGKLDALTTNRGRSFQRGHVDEDTTVVLPLTIKPGTTLTGFYASKHIECGLISIGAISEVVDLTRLNLSRNGPTKQFSQFIPSTRTVLQSAGQLSSIN